MASAPFTRHATYSASYGSPCHHPGRSSHEANGFSSLCNLDARAPHLRLSQRSPLRRSAGRVSTRKLCRLVLASSSLRNRSCRENKDSRTYIASCLLHRLELLIPGIVALDRNQPPDSNLRRTMVNARLALLDSIERRRPDSP